MKISAETKDLLAFASSFNNGFNFNAGSYQCHLSDQKNQAIYAELKEDFPYSFLLPDLKRLNLLIGKLKDSQLSFSDDNYLSIRSGCRFEYRLEIIKQEHKEIREPTPSEKWQWNIEDIFISKKTLSSIHEFSKLNTESNKKKDQKIELFSKDNYLMAFIGKDFNKKNDGLMVSIGAGNLAGRLEINASDLPQIQDDYLIDISENGIIRFKSDRYKMRYYSACKSIR
jgi:hypothetical protein